MLFHTECDIGAQLPSLLGNIYEPRSRINHAVINIAVNPAMSLLNVMPRTKLRRVPMI